MKTKITQFIPALLALIIIGFRYFGLWCTDVGNVCYRTWLDRNFLEVVNPLDSFARYFIIVALIIIFIPRHVFNSWLKFAVWMIPLLLIFIASQPVYSTQIISTDRGDAARLAGGVFAVASLVLIICRALRSARTE